MNELMSARKIDGKWYVDFRHERKRIRRQSPEDSKKGAQAYERVLRSRLAKGEDLFAEKVKEKDKLLYSLFFNSWFEDYVASNNSLPEQKKKRFIYKNYIGPYFGEMPIDEITARDVERFKSWVLKRGIKKKTLNNYLTVLRRSLKSALEWGLISQVPLIRAVKAREPDWDYLTKEEAETLINAPGPLMARTMVQLALRTGMRLGELSALKWEDIDLFNRIIVVRRSYAMKIERGTKNYRSRFIPLADDVIELFEELERRYDVVFHTRHGEYIEHWSALKLLTKQCKAAGIRRVTWHVLRHTFASLLAQNGVPLFTIQQLLGHSTIRMTERYAHFSTRIHHEAVATLIAQKKPNLEKFGQYVGIGPHKELVRNEMVGMKSPTLSNISYLSR